MQNSTWCCPYKGNQLVLPSDSLTSHDPNCLDLLFTDVPDLVGPLVDSPLGNSDHSSISFSVKMGLKILNISFSHKVYLK